LFATTTRQKIEDQLASRVWLLESKSDTTYLNAALDASAFGEVQVPHADDIRRALAWLYHHGNPKVRIPAPLLRAVRSLFLGKDPVELRVFKRLLSSIRASAFLHQLQRPRDSEGYVLATEDDYRIARRALATAFETATSDLTPKMQETWQAVRNLEGVDGATLADIAKTLGIKKKAARERLKSLIARGYIDQDPVSRRYRTVETPDRGVRLPEKLPGLPGPGLLDGEVQNGSSSRSEASRTRPGRDLDALDSLDPLDLDPTVQAVQDRPDRGPGRQKAAPERDFEPGVQESRSERDTKILDAPPDPPEDPPDPDPDPDLGDGGKSLAKSPDPDPVDPPEGPKFEPDRLNSETLVDGVGEPGKASRPSEASGPPENDLTGGAAQDAFRLESYEPVSNPYPLECAGCGKPIAMMMAVRSGDDPRGRVWHVNCAPIRLE
jgi:hypothetical protein